MIRLILIPISFILAGCSTRPDVSADSLGSVDWSTTTPEAEQLAFEHLDSLDRTVFDSAWKSLDGLDYELERTISVHNSDGEVVGESNESLRISGNGPDRRITRLSYDSVGVFEKSFWSRFSEPDSLNDGRWPALVLPEDPLFLSRQGPSFFRYAVLGDTLIVDHSSHECADGCGVAPGDSAAVHGEVVARVELIARPETSRQGIQWARLYLRGSLLVGVELVFIHDSLLYHELSDFRIMLTPSMGTWLPDHVHLRSTVGLPFSRSRSYGLDASYREIESP